MKRASNLIILEIPAPPPGNPDIRDFHINVEISQHPFNSFERPLRESSERYLAEVGSVGSAIINDLFTIDGIIEVRIRQYELTIYIGAAFKWAEVSPQIHAILRKHCADPAAEIAVPIEDPHERFCRGLQELNSVWERPLFEDFGNLQR